MKRKNMEKFLTSSVSTKFGGDEKHIILFLSI